MKKILLLLFFLAAIPFRETVAQEGKNLTIIYTNDVIGEIEPCG